VGADDSPAYQRRTLGRRLRRLRTAAHLTFEQAYERLELSDTTLNRIERGTTGVGIHTVKSMLDLYGVGADEWEPILDQVREANRKGWWVDHGLTNKSYVAMETAASVVCAFDFGHINGLLQTEDYMTAIFEARVPAQSAKQLHNLIAIRRIRQQRLLDAHDPLELVTVVDESALRRKVGGREVMRAQLLHLLEMARIATIVVLPASVGGHMGLYGSFVVLDFPDPKEPSIGYFEHVARETFVNRNSDVERCRLTWEHLRSLALGVEDSQALIRRILDEL
jgi:DNA-binding XRE family transcriptional regulator